MPQRALKAFDLRIPLLLDIRGHKELERMPPRRAPAPKAKA